MARCYYDYDELIEPNLLILGKKPVGPVVVNDAGGIITSSRWLFAHAGMRDIQRGIELTHNGTSIVDNSLYFPGSTDYASTDFYLKPGSDHIVISVWVYLLSKNDYPRILDMYDGTDSYQICLDSGRLCTINHARQSISAGIEWVGTSEMTTDAWHHIFAYSSGDADYQRLWFNGTERTQIDTTDVNAAGTFTGVRLGIRRDLFNVTDLHGYITDVMFGVGIPSDGYVRNLYRDRYSRLQAV